MNFRYIPSYYYLEQKEVVAEEVAPVEPIAPVVEEVDDTITAVEPEPVVYKEPVFSSYFDEEQVPLAYRMKYTISAPSVAAQPAVQVVAPVVEEKAPVVEQLPEDYFLRPAEASEALVEKVAPVAAAPNKALARTYTVYKNHEEASNYAWADQAEEGEVLPTYTHTPYQSRARVQEESTYVGFQNDVYAAYGKPSVPAIYSMTPSAPMVSIQTPAQAVASLECLTAEEGPAYGATVAPAAPRSRFVSQVKAAPLPQQSQKPSMDYRSVEGNAFRPVVKPQSEYQYGGLNDLVSCINV